jgi:hypothetical protein
MQAKKSLSLNFEITYLVSVHKYYTFSISSNLLIKHLQNYGCVNVSYVTTLLYKTVFLSLSDARKKRNFKSKNKVGK